MTKSSDPLHRIGVYKTLAQVPDHNRLGNSATAFAGRDVWAEYIDAELSGASESVLYEAGLVEDSWKAHMQERGRHPALATPADVETWAATLLDRMQTKRAYNPYWVRLDELYTYLVWHTEYPHSYHPPRMAAGQDGAARQIWDYKVRDWSV